MQVSSHPGPSPVLFGHATPARPAAPRFGDDESADRFQRVDLNDPTARAAMTGTLRTLADNPAIQATYTDPGSQAGGYKASFQAPGEENPFEVELPADLRVSHIPEDEDELAAGPEIKFFKALAQAPFVRMLTGQ